MRPRIRTVKPEMRKDERYGRMSIPARELFNGMITMADDEGRFRALSSAILGDVFPYDDDAPRKLKTWVAEVKDSGMVVFYVADGNPYGAFRHWARHQKINRPSPSDLPPPPDPKIVRDNSLAETSSGWKQASRSGADASANGPGSLHDISVSFQDLFTELSGSTHTPPRERAFRSDPDHVRSVLQNGLQLTEPQRATLLSGLLAAWIVHNDPKAQPDLDSETWRRDMQRLLADRQGDFNEVARVIDWCQADAFWRSNILSPGKLRKQFTQLVIKAKRPAGDVVAFAPRSTPSDLLRKLRDNEEKAS